MLSSSMLEVVVGLFLVFFVFATICSGVAEWISRALRLRADYLLRGLRNMLDGAGKKQRQGIPVIASTAVGGPGSSEGASPGSSPSATAPDQQPNSGSEQRRQCG